MIQVVRSYATLGLEGYEVQVEADSARAIPTIDIIGLPDAAIKEAKERLRATMRNCGLELPPRKIILNLAPSDIKKVGTAFDLPMAVAMLALIHDTTHLDSLSGVLFFGELGLDGSIKRINGLLPAVLSAIKRGYEAFFVPQDNLAECAYIPGIRLYPVSHFKQVIQHVVYGEQVAAVQDSKTLADLSGQEQSVMVDFAHIKGHSAIKRALSIAAAGSHNVLLVGAPGSGKTMLSKALQGILPPLGFDEVLEVSQVYSVMGKLNKEQPLITQRPFRRVHHTASKVSIVGGGQRMTPGEISLAHKGILFFDEVPEFPRPVLEVLRQPMEDKVVTISRANGSVQYPANFMFVGAMNPCKCGFYKDRDKACSCSMHDIKRYQSKLSGPLLDRIDMILEVPRENIETIMDGEGERESSATIREQVVAAWSRQQERFAGTKLRANAHMGARALEEFMTLDTASKDFLQQAAKSLHLSARVVHRVMKLARTIADLQGQENIVLQHVAEAMQYRSRAMFVEG